MRFQEFLLFSKFDPYNYNVINVKKVKEKKKYIIILLFNYVLFL